MSQRRFQFLYRDAATMLDREACIGTCESIRYLVKGFNCRTTHISNLQLITHSFRFPTDLLIESFHSCPTILLSKFQNSYRS
jgi:hypothetical protein